MSAKIRILLLGIAFVLVPSLAMAETAGEMALACRLIVKAGTAGDRVDLPPGFEPGTCWGAFSMVQEIIRMIDDNKRPYWNICYPGGTTRTELVGIFKVYLVANPNRANDQFFAVAINSLQAKFPCPKL